MEIVGVRGGLPQKGKWWRDGGVGGAPFSSMLTETYTTVHTYIDYVVRCSPRTMG